MTAHEARLAVTKARANNTASMVPRILSGIQDRAQLGYNFIICKTYKTARKKLTDAGFRVYHIGAATLVRW